MRSYGGHVNEKNFVGLTVNGDYMACGSEDNAVYVYYKALERPVVKFACSEESADHPGEHRNFVSSVAWRKDGDVVLAANTMGLVHVLKLN